MDKIELKDIKQLKKNYNKDYNNKIIENGILDSRIYNYEKVFGYKRLTKEESLNLYDIECNHAMSFVGVHLVDDKPIRWKVENS